MSKFNRMLGYASIGAAKVAAKRAWNSKSYIESAVSAAEAGMWAESAVNLLKSNSSKDMGRNLPTNPQFLRQVKRR